MKLTPEQTVRLLRAKMGELEHLVRTHYELAEQMGQDVDLTVQLAADIALVAGILADFIEVLELRRP